MKPLRLGLKYCGGCSPRYDRVEWVTKFENAMGDSIELRGFDDPDVDAVLVVMGCESACVDLSPFDGKPVFTVSAEKQTDQIIRRLEEEMSKWK